MNISINTLSQSLMKQINAKALNAVEKRATAIIHQVHSLAKDWKKIIREHMSKPAISRGRTKGRLNPHNKWGMNQGFPMLVNGALSKSARVSVTQRKTKHGVTITVKRWFNPTMNKGRDYGHELDENHTTLMGWKERAYDILDAKIRSL